MKLKQKTLSNIIVLFALLFGINISSNAQTFSGITYFKKAIEWEGQRFLMDKIYEISTTEIDKLKIRKILKETDQAEGFMFVLTLYSFNEKNGVIITSYNTTISKNLTHQFVNVHLTQEEFVDLSNKILSLSEMLDNKHEHLLKKFNTRLIIDVSKGGGDPKVSIWIDNYSRHTFTIPKWFEGYNTFVKFVNIK